jgi:NADH:ubiquinone oxidoreductase subunit 6 (subunit J)
MVLNYGHGGGSMTLQAAFIGVFNIVVKVGAIVILHL